MSAVRFAKISLRQPRRVHISDCPLRKAKAGMNVLYVIRLVLFSHDKELNSKPDPTTVSLGSRPQRGEDTPPFDTCVLVYPPTSDMCIVG